MRRRWEFEPRTEQVSVARACGRVLAQDCHARYDLPRHRVSSFDGIAVRSADFAAGLPDTSRHGFAACQFAQADTGDDFPDEFGTARAAEDVRYDDEGRLTLSPDLAFRKGNAVKRAGATMGEGELFGTRKGPSLAPRPLPFWRRAAGRRFPCANGCG